jgi:hypothetical protein
LCSDTAAEAEGGAQAHIKNKILWEKLEKLFVVLLACFVSFQFPFTLATRQKLDEIGHFLPLHLPGTWQSTINW